MQNPFTTTFSKTPENTYITTEKTQEILENFSYDNPSESVYKITGVRGSGKTVILAKVEDALRSEDKWKVFDLNPTRDLLLQMAAMLENAGFGVKKHQGRSISVSSSILGTGGGLSYAEGSDVFSDIGVNIEKMLEAAKQKGVKILVGIDEVSRTRQMVEFASEYGKWLRLNFPVYLVCTGLYENIQDLCNVSNLTFFRRATTVKTDSLNFVRMTEMYKEKLSISGDIAKKMAACTKGYAYAFQELGTLYFKKKEEEGLEDLIPKLQSELFAYSYEKIWEEMTPLDRQLAMLLVEKEENKREDILPLLGEKAKSYSMYRDRLIKRGIVTGRQGYISLALPYFGAYIKEYGLEDFGI